MKSIKELKATMPQVGKVEWIGVRSKRKEALTVVSEVTIDVATGLEGDHNTKQGGTRMITLIQGEHIDMMENILNRTISPLDLRRNIVVSGINLLALHDQHFMLGDNIVLAGSGYCVPCSRMEHNLGPGGYNAMRGHGGITATVVSGGTLVIGDKVYLK